MLKIKNKIDLNMLITDYNFEYIKTNKEYKRVFRSEGISLIIDETTRNIYFRQLKDNSFPEMKSYEMLYDLIIAGLVEKVIHN